MIKKDKKLEKLNKLKALVGDKPAEKVYEQSEKMKDDIAKIVTGIASEKTKLPAVPEFEKEVRNAMKELGIVDRKTYNDIKERVTNSEAFKWLVENEITDEELLQTLKEGLKATKLVNAGGIPAEVDDYEQRGKFFDRIAKLRGLDVVDDSKNVNFNLTVIAPDDESGAFSVHNDDNRKTITYEQE